MTIAVDAVVPRGRARSGNEVDLTESPGASFVREHGGKLIAGRGAFCGEPIFFSRVDGELRWSRSLRSLAGLAPLELDPEGVREYLALGFVPAPKTLLRGIESVPPGHVLQIDSRTGRREQHVAAPSLDRGAATPETFWEALERPLQESHFDAVLLSGGLDSAAIAVAAAPARLQAVHVRFPARPLEEDTETRAARAIARELSMPYREVSISGLRALRGFSKAVTALDQPLGDPVVLPFFQAFETLAGGCVLTGEGGDQLFGSWATKPMLLHDLYSRGRSGGSRAGSGSLGAARDEDPDLLLRAYRESYHKLAGRTDELLAAGARTAPGPSSRLAAIEEAWRSSPVLDYRERLRWIDIRLKAMQHILPRINGMAGAHGCEVRHPFFDPELVGQSFALPELLRVSGSREKPLLKDLLAERLPAELVERRKEGMGVPTSVWFKLALRPLVWRWLSRRQLRRTGALREPAVRALVSGDLKPRDARRRRWGDLLWQLCVLQAWVADVGRHGGS